MTYPLEDDVAREKSQREEKQRAKLEEAQHRKDVQAVFGTEEGRRVLWAFLQAAGADVSPLRADGLTTGHAIGWADAGGWWLNQVRAHCPERETNMRAEAQARAKTLREVAQDEEGNDDN